MKKLFLILVIIFFTIPSFALYAPGNGQFINTYLLLGTFDNSDFNKEYINGEPYEGLKEGNKKWEYFDDRYFSRNYDDYIDLFSYYRYKLNENIEKKCAYLHVYVWSDSDKTAQIRGDGDSYFRVWFNGNKIIEDIDNTITLKDKNVANINLKKGYNSIMVKIGNETLTYLGFYLRICDQNGNEVPGIRYCLNKTEEVKIETKSLLKAGKHSIPFGFREWPYVEYRVPLYDKLDYERMNAKKEQLKYATSASFFYFSASGNSEIEYSIIKGKLPKGLTFESDGSIRGRIASDVKLGDYNFTVKAKGENNSDTKNFVLTVKERPTKWIDEGGLTALIHNPEAVTDNEQIKEIALQMKRQNYTLAMPIAYGNGDHFFRWDSAFNKEELDFKHSNCMKQYKTALEEAGVPFGMYIGNFLDCPQFQNNQGVLVLEDAMKKLDPKAFWFDWSGIERYDNDALYSAIKSNNPNLVIILNGMWGYFANGDYDIISQEGLSYGNPEILWTLWPTESNYNIAPFLVEAPKIGGVETWRFMANMDSPVQPLVGKKAPQDWADVMRLEIALRGSGIIANIDHSSWVDSSKNKSLYESHVMENHKKMADWANPLGLTPLWTSYTNATQYKFENSSKPENLPWGYATINTNKDKIYLHFMIDRRGKTGLPKEEYFTCDIIGKVKSVTCMNTGKNVSFKQNGKKLTIDLKNITQDEVDTILSVNLTKPIEYYPVHEDYPLENWTKREEIKIRQTSVVRGKDGDIAYDKPSKILDIEGNKELGASWYVRLALNGNDNDMDTDVAAGGHYDWSYWLDLEKPYNVKKIVLDFNGKGGIAIDFDIVVSNDNQNWETILSYKDNKEEHFIWNIDKNFRYIKVKGYKPNGPDQGGQMAINNIEIYE